MAQDFKKLRVWQAAKDFTIDIYKVTEKFPVSEQYAMVQQLRRAAYSVPSNIAEGCGKTSQKELARYLSISNGSIKEVENFLILAKELGYLSKQDYSVLSENLEKIAKMNSRLLKNVRD
ncbi:MAG: four helix bundle protein [archaeon]